MVADRKYSTVRKSFYTSHLGCIYAYHSAVKPCHMVHLRQNAMRSSAYVHITTRNRKKIVDDDEVSRKKRARKKKLFIYLTLRVDIIDNNSQYPINGTRENAPLSSA